MTTDVEWSLHYYYYFILGIDRSPVDHVMSPINMIVFSYWYLLFCCQLDGNLFNPFPRRPTIHSLLRHRDNHCCVSMWLGHDGDPLWLITSYISLLCGWGKENAVLEQRHKRTVNAGRNVIVVEAGDHYYYYSATHISCDPSIENNGDESSKIIFHNNNNNVIKSCAHG